MTGKLIIALTAMMWPLIIVLIALLCATLAFAHSWYPRECCSDKDCKPVACDSLSEGELITPRSSRIPAMIYTEGGAKYYGEKRWLKPSPDDQCHVCIQPGTMNMRCTFIPMRST